MQAPAPQAAMRRREVLISLDMGEVAAELAQEKQRQQSAGGTGAQTRGLAAPEAFARCCANCRFLCTCAIGMLHSMAPPTLAAAEAACLLAVYLAAVPNAFPTHSRHLVYTFPGSAEDVVLLSLLRCAAVTLAHCMGSGPLFQRPYLLTAAAFACVSLPLGLMKLAALVHRSQWGRRQWPPFIALYCLHMGFAVAQVLAAQRIVEWARTRWEHGLAGLGFPWQEGEDTWLLAGHLQSQAEEGEGAPEQDVPADELAEGDSRWARCGTLRVHYKLALPLGMHEPAGTGIVLLHSFGGGAFTWRHVMQPLADACGLPVLAFDRPGFGLTDRPRVQPGTPLERNPYSLKSQALLTLRLASQLGLRRIVLAGHCDGALLALMSAAIAAREAAMCTPLALPGGAGAGAGAAAQQAGLPAGLPYASHQRYGSVGSVPDSLDLGWIGSHPDASHSLIQKLLRGEWPASIDPRWGTGVAGGSLLAGWGDARGAGARPSPQRLRRSVDLLRAAQQAQQARQQGSSSGEGGTAGAAGSLVEPAPSLLNNPSFLSQASTQVSCDVDSSEAALGPQSSLIQNPSFLSHPSSQVTPARTEPAEAPLHQQGSSQDQLSGLQDNPSFLSDPRSSSHSGSGASGGGEGAAGLDGQASLIDNPSFLSQTSDREQWAAGRYSDGGGAAQAGTAAAAAQSQQCGLRQGSGGGDGGAKGQGAAGGWGGPELEEQLLEGIDEESSLLVGSLGDMAGVTHEGGAVVAQEGCGQQEEQPAWHEQHQQHQEQPAWHEEQQQQQHQEQPTWHEDQQQQHQEQPAWQEEQQQQEQDLRGVSTDGQWDVPEPAGLILLHPDLSGNVAPKYARVLAHSRLGRRVLRSLLRTEVGEVSNRRAWADPLRLTPELLATFRRPLHVVGWDLALTEVARVRNDIHSLERSQLLGAVAEAGLPVLVATGESDHIVPPSAASRIAERLGAAAPRLAVLPLCGHLSHEEAPPVWLDFVHNFLFESGMCGGA